MRTRIIIFIFVLPLVAIAGSIKDDNYNINLKRALESPSWGVRFNTINNIDLADFVDTLGVVETLLDALKGEIEKPISKELRSGQIKTPTDALKEQYISAISRFGNIAEQKLLGVNDSSGQLLEWAQIGLGLLAKEKYKPALIKLFSNSPDPEVKLMSIRALAEYQSPSDTLYFIKALYDPYKFESPMDRDVPGGDFKEDIYPVHMEARSALRKIGYTVLSDSAGGYTIRRQ